MFRESCRQCQLVLRRGRRLFARESGASGGAWVGQTQQDANILRLAAQQRRWQHSYRDNRCCLPVALMTQQPREYHPPVVRQSW